MMRSNVILLLFCFMVSTKGQFICDPDCFNGGTCVMGVCSCPPQFTGLFCESECPVPMALNFSSVTEVTQFINLNISCLPDQVLISMSACEIKELVGADTVLLTDPSDPILVTQDASSQCLPTFKDGKATIQADHLHPCGAAVQITPEQFIFDYAIVSARNLSASSLIYKPKYRIFMQFSCEISRVQTVSISAAVVPYYKSLSVYVPSDEGEFYITAGYLGSNESEVVDDIVTVDVPETITIGFEVDSSISDDYIAQVQSCYATPTSDGSGVIRYTLIQDGCTFDNKTLVSTRSANGVVYVSFNSFVWNHIASPQYIYVICSLSMCIGGQCPEQCADREKRQETDTSIDGVPLTFGPVAVRGRDCMEAECDTLCSMEASGGTFCFCVDDAQMLDDGVSCTEPRSAGQAEGSATPWWVFLLAGLALLILLVVLIIVGVRYYRQRRAEDRNRRMSMMSLAGRGARRSTNLSGADNVHYVSY